MAKKTPPAPTSGPHIRNSNMVGPLNDLNNYAVKDEQGNKQWAESVRNQQAATVDRIKAIAEKNQTNSVKSSTENQTLKP